MTKNDLEMTSGDLEMTLRPKMTPPRAPPRQMLQKWKNIIFAYLQRFSRKMTKTTRKTHFWPFFSEVGTFRDA